MASDARLRRVTSDSEAAAVSLTAVANVAVNRLPARASIPANVGAAGLLLWFARHVGATWSDMGLDLRRVGSGVRWGIAAAVPIAGTVALSVAIPVTRRYLVDERAAVARPRELAYQVLVRIPLGTALTEEALFRGALLGVFERRHSRRIADALSGLLFGLWHILPTIDRLGGGGASGFIGMTGRARATAVGGVVLATMAAGAGFAWLRDQSGSLLAPVIAHAALNGLALLGARVASRSGSFTSCPRGPAEGVWYDPRGRGGEGYALQAHRASP